MKSQTNEAEGVLLNSERIRRRIRIVGAKVGDNYRKTFWNCLTFM